MKRRNFLKNIGLAVAVAPIVPVLKAEEKNPSSFEITGTSIDDSGNRVFTEEIFYNNESALIQFANDQSLVQFEEENDQDFRGRLLKREQRFKGELLSLHIDGKIYPVNFD